MSRQPDSDLEERILKAALALWRRGGDKALTLRAVARAAGRNTPPAVYRRFKDRRDLVRAVLGITVARIGKIFTAGTIEQMTEAYVDWAGEEPREFELFYMHAREIAPLKRSGRAKPIRESPPNFAPLEQTLAKQVGGSPEDHTRLAMALWATIHGTSVMLLSRAIEGPEEELRSACHEAVKTILDGAANFSEKKADRSRSAGVASPAAWPNAAAGSSGDVSPRIYLTAAWEGKEARVPPRPQRSR